jgi:hypothetical protein
VPVFLIGLGPIWAALEPAAPRQAAAQAPLTLSRSPANTTTGREPNLCCHYEHDLRAVLRGQALLASQLRRDVGTSQLQTAATHCASRHFAEGVAVLAGPL